MKKILSLCLLVTCLGLVGCAGKKDYSEYDFVDVSWTRTTEADTEYLRFSADGHFSYYCACGNPVDDSDVYEEYTYSEKSQTIKLKPSGVGFSKKLVIKYVDEETLEIDFGGEIRKFEIEKELEMVDTITYKNEQYILLEYNADIFYYDYNSTTECEEDVIYPVVHPKWKMAYVNGDLFVHEEDKEVAETYYSDDNNYEWYIVIDEDEGEKKIPISMSEQDVEYIYQMDDLEKDQSLLFDDIEKFASLEKSSKDGIIYARISLAYYQEKWYWRTETIDEDKDGWPEYVFELPKEITEQIKLVGRTHSYRLYYFVEYSFNAF